MAVDNQILAILVFGCGSSGLHICLRNKLLRGGSDFEPDTSIASCISEKENR